MWEILYSKATQTRKHYLLNRTVYIFSIIQILFNHNRTFAGFYPHPPPNTETDNEMLYPSRSHMNFLKKRILITLIHLSSVCPYVVSCCVSMLRRLSGLLSASSHFHRTKDLAGARCAVMPLSFNAKALWSYGHSASIHYSISTDRTNTVCCKDNTCRSTCLLTCAQVHE